MKLDGRRMSDNISDRRGERMNMTGGGLSLLRLLAILPGGIKTKLIGLALVAAVEGLSPTVIQVAFSYVLIALVLRLIKYLQVK